MFCKSCGESLKAGVKFCGKCGATIEVTALEGIQCPKCGAINRLGAKFCRQDGTPLVDAPAMSQGPGAVPPSAERAASQAAPTVSPVTREPPPAELAPPPRLVHAEAVQIPAGGTTSRLWLAIGALVVLAAAGGGYWLYKSRDASPQVVEATQEPDSQTPETYAPRAQEGDVVEPPAPATRETPSSAQSQVADAPQVSVGDRWVTEVVDHQDAALSYRAERTVTDVGPDRIFTSVRTLGKDYTRVVQYTGEWALVATHLRSGATTSYSPALPYLSFPLQTGRSWQERVVETDAEGKQRVHNVRAQMESWETVQVPAGTFESLKIVLSDDISKDGVVVQQGQDVSWYAPEARRTVKTEETSFDPATGERRRRTISLVEYSVGQGDGSVSGSQDRSPAMTESSMNITPLFAGMENSCSPPEEFQALLKSLGYTEKQANGRDIWKMGAPVIPERYRPALGALAMSDKGEYTQFTMPLSGTYYGLPVTQLRRGEGNDNRISFYAIRIAAPADEVARVLRGKLNRTQRLLYETEGPPIEARVLAEDGASLLECNFSD